MGLRRLAQDGKSEEGGSGYLSDVSPGPNRGDDAPEFLDREAIVLHVGDFASQDGPVKFDEKRLKKAVEVNNARIAQLAESYGGADKIPIGEYPRVMEDHEGEKPSRATIGRMMGPFSIVKTDVPKLGLKDVTAIKCGKVRFLGKENTSRARDGRIHDLSLGVNEKMGDLFDELSAVGEGAAPGARLLGKGKLRMASYKGVSYEVDSKGRDPYTMYQAYCEDLGIESGWKASATEAATELRKLIDESIADRDLSRGKKSLSNSRAVDKIIQDYLSGAITESKAIRLIEEKGGMSTSDAQGVLEAAETKARGLSKSKLSKGGHLMAKKTQVSGKKRLAKLVVAHTNIKALAAELGTAKTKLVGVSDRVRLAARTAKIDGDVRGLIRLGKMTPAEYKNLKLAELAKLDDGALKICLSAFSAREKPVIEPGQRGSLDAVDQGTLAKEIGKKRLRAETREDMKRAGIRLSASAEAEHKADKEALAGGGAVDDAKAPKKDLAGGDGDGNGNEAHMNEYKKHMGDLQKHLDGGNLDEAKKSFALAQKMGLGDKHLAFGDSGEEGDARYSEMQEQLDSVSTLVSKLAAEVDKVLAVESEEGHEELEAGDEPAPGKKPGEDDDAA